MGHDLNADWQPGDPVAYISPEAPAAIVPPYRGERYEALVPDILDVAERARQVINPLTETTDADADREIYFMGSSASNRLCCATASATPTCSRSSSSRCRSCA